MTLGTLALRASGHRDSRVVPIGVDSNPTPALVGRGRGIRTPDILLPKQARYQTALYPGVGEARHRRNPKPRRIYAAGGDVKLSVSMVAIRASAPRDPGSLQVSETDVADVARIILERTVDRFGLPVGARAHGNAGGSQPAPLG